VNMLYRYRNKVKKNNILLTTSMTMFISNQNPSNLVRILSIGSYTDFDLE